MPSPRVTAILLASACLVVAAAAAPLIAQANADALSDAVASLNSGDRDRVMAGRASLLTLLNAARTNPPVLTTFSRDLGTALMPVASGKDPHAKLNAAIVVHRVAEQSGSVALADISAKLIADPSPAVAAYGMRAASNVLPRMLADEKLAANNPIMPAVLAAVKAHPASEAVAAESYQTIVRVLNDRTAAEVLTPAGVAAATPRAVDAVHKLMALRISQLGTGSVAEPGAEQPGISFLGRAGTWTVSTPAQRNETVRTLLQLMQSAAREMGQVPAGSASRLRLEALRNLVKSSAGSLSVIVQPTVANKPALLPSVQKAAALGLATPVNDYRQVIEQVAADFAREMPDAAGPATKPATAPAGAPPAPGAAPGAAPATPPSAPARR